MGVLEDVANGVPDVYNRFNRNKKYKGILFKADEPSQSAEFNELQSIIVDENKQLIQSLFGEGRIFSGGNCEYSPGAQHTTHVQCLPGSGITAGSYFLFSTLVDDYLVFYTINGSGIEPVVAGRTNIPVNVLSTDNSTVVAQKTYDELSTLTEVETTHIYSKVLIVNDTVGVTTEAGEGTVPTGFTISTAVTGSDISAVFNDTVFYAFDYTNDIAKIELPISTGETVKVGIAISQQVVTELEDPELVNPAIGTINEGLPGAKRLKLDGRWCKETDVVSGETFFEIYDIVDGILIQPELRSPEIESTINLIGDYDNDANGSYVNSGFNITFDQNISSVEGDPEDLHQMNISEGIAHVDGRRLQYNYGRKFTIPFIGSTETAVVNNESVIFSGSGWYTLSKDPFKDITEVNGIAEVTDLLVRDPSDMLDLIHSGDRSVVSLASTIVGQISGVSTTFYINTHYVLYDNQVHWLSSYRPSPGTSYNLTYQYNRLVVLLEAELDRDNNKIYLSGFKSGQRIDVDYSYYLTRVDRVCLLKDGSINVELGRADYYSPIPPDVYTGLSLGLCTVRYGKTPEIAMSYYRAFQMKDVQLMFQEIDNLRFNVARLAQLQNIGANDPATDKINSFTDPFLDDDLRDEGLVQRALISAGLLIPGYDLQQNTLTLGSKKLLTLDYTTTLEIDQWRFTGNRQVNEFMWKDPPPLQVSVSPSVYTWVAEIIVKTIVEYNVLATEKGKTWHPGWRYDTAFWYKPVYVSTTVINDTLSRTSKIYTVPTINLTVSASKLNSYESAYIKFDGKQLASTYAANVEGVITASFPLPAGTKSGSKLIEVEGRENHQRGRNTFTAIPLIENITKLTTYDVVEVLEDPVAEVFSLTQDRFITDVSIQITTLPTSYIDIFILPTVVGFPDRANGIAVKRLYRSQLTVSKDSSTLSGRTFVWNTFTFDSPVLLKANVEYAVVVSCTDPHCRVRFARLGEYELTRNKWQTTQAYPTGVLLTSSTGSSWLPEHKDDLTFRLSRAVFTGTLTEGYLTKTFNFGTINVTNCTDIFLSTNFEILPNTIVKYYVTLLDRLGSTPIEITPMSFFQIETTGSNIRYTGRVQLTCTLGTNSSNISPRISNTCTLSWGTVVLPSEYITRAFDLDVTATHAKLNIELHEPSENTTTVYLYTTKTSNMWMEVQTLGEVGVCQVCRLIAYAHDYYEGGEYFRISTPSNNYYVWFTKNGVGRNPNTHGDHTLTGYTGVVVDVITSDTDVMIANKIAYALNTGLTGKFTASTSGTNLVTTTSIEAGVADAIEDGVGWRKMARTGVVNFVDYEVYDRQFVTTLLPSFRLLEAQDQTRIKVVLDNPNYDRRPFGANLRAYFYAQ